MSDLPSPPPPPPPGEAPDFWQEEAYAPSTWPMVIGIISIVWSVLLLGCTGVSIVGLAAWFGSPEVQRVVPQYQVCTGLVIGVIQLCLFGVLLTGGITCLMRKPVTRPLHLGYAGVALFVTTVNLIMSILLLTGGTVPEEQARVQSLGLPCGAVLGYAYPVFILIWFLRGAIAREVASWRNR